MKKKNITNILLAETKKSEFPNWRNSINNLGLYVKKLKTSKEKEQNEIKQFKKETNINPDNLTYQYHTLKP